MLRFRMFWPQPGQCRAGARNKKRCGATRGQLKRGREERHPQAGSQKRWPCPTARKSAKPEVLRTIRWDANTEVPALYNFFTCFCAHRCMPWQKPETSQGKPCKPQAAKQLGRIGMGCKAQIAAIAVAIARICNAADHPRPSKAAALGVLQHFPRYPGESPHRAHPAGQHRSFPR